MEIKCLICGMKVNEASYNLNECTFVDKNEKDRIINCPFCGVGKIYLNSQKPIYSINSKVLDKQTKKILDNAMKLEVFNGEFYEEASRLAKSEYAKQLFKDLKNIEFMHARIHKNLGGFTELPKLRRPDYSRHETDELLLQEAYKREKHAIDFYQKNIDIILNDTIKEIFKALSEVEKQHMTIADK